MKKFLASMMAVMVIGFTAMNLSADDAKKEQPKSPFDKDSCCAKAHVKAELCAHECCLAAAKENKVCKKCNATNGDKAIFTADSCCAKAAADGKACDHPCCVTANKASGICNKCNKVAEKKEEKKK